MNLRVAACELSIEDRVASRGAARSTRMWRRCNEPSVVERTRFEGTPEPRAGATREEVMEAIWVA
jgi:hypothetical protein